MAGIEKALKYIISIYFLQQIFINLIWLPWRIFIFIKVFYCIKTSELFIKLITIVAVPLLGIAALAFFRHCDPMQANIGRFLKYYR